MHITKCICSSRAEWSEIRGRERECNKAASTRPTPTTTTHIHRNCSSEQKWQSYNNNTGGLIAKCKTNSLHAERTSRGFLCVASGNWYACTLGSVLIRAHFSTSRSHCFTSSARAPLKLSVMQVRWCTCTGKYLCNGLRVLCMCIYLLIGTDHHSLLTLWELKRGIFF
jgi:hypothetical protein